MTEIRIPDELIEVEDPDLSGGFRDWRAAGGMTHDLVARHPGEDGPDDPRQGWPGPGRWPNTPPIVPPTMPPGPGWPRSRAPLPRWPMPDDGTGEWDVLWRENRRHDAFIDAATKALKALLGLEKELDASAEPSQSERRYREGLKKITAEHGAKLDEASGRRFRSELEGVAAARLPDLVARSRRRELDRWKERLDDSLVVLREAALTAGSGRAERSILEQILGRIDLAAGLGLVADATQGQTEFMAAYEAERARRTAEAEAANIAASEPVETADTTIDTDDAAPADEGSDGMMEAAEDSDSDADAVTTEAADTEDALLGDAGEDVVEVTARDEPESEDRDGATGDGTDGRVPATQQVAQATDGRAQPAVTRTGATGHIVDEEQARRRLQGRIDPRRTPIQRGDAERIRQRHVAASNPDHLPSVPDYRSEVRAVSGNWVGFNHALLEIFGNDVVARQIVLRRIAAEGGMARDQTAGGSAFGGITRAAIADIKRDFRNHETLGARVQALPDNPSDVTLSQLALAHALFPEVQFRDVGARAGLVEGVGRQTAEAIMDASFHLGRRDSGPVFAEAITETDPMFRGDPRLAGPFGPGMLAIIRNIQARGLSEKFLRQLIKIHKEHSHVSEHRRIEHFGERWP